MYKKRSTFYVVFLIIVTILISMLFECKTSTSEAIPIPEVKENIYIYDEGEILDGSMEKQLNEFLVQLEEKTETEFIVVSVKSLSNRSVENYANNLFKALSMGRKDSTVVLLFSQTDGKVALKMSEDLKNCLNDSRCDRILNDYFDPYCEENEYSKAIEMTVKAVLNVLAEEYDIEIQGLDELKLSKESVFSIIIIMFFTIIGSMIFAFVNLREVFKEKQ